MKKAVIVCGGTQHLVSEGQVLTVNYIIGEKKTIDFDPIMLVDGKDSVVDAENLAKVKVSTKILEELQGDKVIALRYKAKKRVHTRRGHRQKLTKLQIVSIK